MKKQLKMEKKGSDLKYFYWRKNMSQKVYGYIRVSSKDQNEDRQIIAMREKNIPVKNCFIDKQSGKDFERPAYQKLIATLKRGDLLVVKSIDRLGRNYKEIMEQWQKITKEIGADITILDMPLLDTTNSKDLLGTFISDIVLQLLSFVSENERENIRRRQAEGIAAAKARGIKWGGRYKEMPADFPELYRQWMKKDIGLNEFASRCGVCKSTLFKRIKEYRNSNRFISGK